MVTLGLLWYIFSDVDSVIVIGLKEWYKHMAKVLHFRLVQTSVNAAHSAFQLCRQVIMQLQQASLLLIRIRMDTRTTSELWKAPLDRNL